MQTNYKNCIYRKITEHKEALWMVSLWSCIVLAFENAVFREDAADA